MESSKRTFVRTLAGAVVVVTAFAAGAFAQAPPVKIGLLATLEGPFAAGGQDGMRGAELAVRQRNGVVAGRKIEIIKASSDAKPDVAVNATRKLVEQDKVDIMVGPLSGSEGIAVKEPGQLTRRIVAALVGAFAMEKLGRDSIVRTVMRLSVGIVMVMNLTALALNDLVDVENPRRAEPQLSFVRYDLGQFTREEFVARMGRGVLEPIIWMNENLPKDAKVLYVGEARVYYATHPVLWSTAFDQHPLSALSREAKTPDELVAALRARGVTHLYVNYAELERLRSGYNYMIDANWNLVRDTVGSNMREVHRSGPGIVYELIK